MDLHDHKRQELIARAIAACCADAGADPGGRRIEPWKQLAVHLCPLIGDSGFVALYRRAVRMIELRFAWMAPDESTTVDESLAALRTQLESADPAMVGEANAALLHTFTQLLSGLIGEALTIRLLNAAWNSAHGKPIGREQI